MSASATITEEQQRVLSRLTELGLALAEKLQAQAMAAEDPKETAELALGFQRTARAVRQSIALSAKLAEDAARAERLARDDDARQAALALDKRKVQVRAAVGRAIVLDVERHRVRDYMEFLDERLERESLFDGFADEPLMAQVERLCRRLGVTPESDLDDDEDDALDEATEERFWAGMDARSPAPFGPTPPDPGIHGSGEATSPHSRRSG